MCQGSKQREGVLFLKHNIRDEFDDVSDVARWYRIKHVPCFTFFVGGAQVGIGLLLRSVSFLGSAQFLLSLISASLAVLRGHSYCNCELALGSLDEEERLSIALVVEHSAPHGPLEGAPSGS